MAWRLFSYTDIYNSFGRSLSVLYIRINWIYVRIRANIHIPKGKTKHQNQRRTKR